VAVQQQDGEVGHTGEVGIGGDDGQIPLQGRRRDQDVDVADQPRAERRAELAPNRRVAPER
jgi:hypothetical protein